MNASRHSRTPLSSALVAFTLALTLAACSSAPEAPTEAALPAGSEITLGTPVDADITTDTPLEAQAVTVATGDNVLKTASWTSATNGYGPVELNRSNGENKAGDGRTLTLNGRTYATGYGVHAGSKLTFTLDGSCTALTADIGVDDEVGTRGSVVFQVYGDSTKLYDSGSMTGASTTKSIKVDITGRKNLHLVVTDGGNGNAYDHADWAVPTLRGCISTASLSTSAADPEGTTYVKLAGEGSAFTVSGTQTVRYGADTRWIYKTVTSSGTCSNAFFGGDPAWGVGKACYLVVAPATSTVAAPAPAPAPTPAPAPAPAPAPEIVYSAPITITRGGTYTGAWESLNPAVPAVTVKTAEPVVIENCALRGKGALISAPWSNATLTVRGCTGQGLNPNDVNRVPGRFLIAEGFVSVLVERNTFTKTSGIYLNAWRGTAATPTTITIRQNHARDIEGRYSDGMGGFQNGKFYRVQFVQLNSVKDAPRVDIGWNRVDETPRASHVEDTINLYASSGTATSPIRVHHNLINGAYAGNPAASYSGGGIMMGDGGGAYQEATDNTVLETSNYGVAVAGGNYMTVRGNLVLGLGKLADGTLLDADTDAGIYLRDYAADPAHLVSSVVASGNTVGWGNPSATNPNGRWDLSVSSKAGVDGGNTRVGPTNAAIPASLLSDAISAWESRAAAAGKVIGDR